MGHSHGITLRYNVGRRDEKVACADNAGKQPNDFWAFLSEFMGSLRYGNLCTYKFTLLAALGISDLSEFEL
jgi:hypothetical protein